MADLNIDIARLQKEIADRLGLQSSQVVFDFSLNEGVTKLDLITISQRHEQSFLYHTTKAIDKKEALEKMYEYVATQHKNESTYTLQWRKVGDTELHTSYFSARNMYEALDKFYYNREMNSFNIFSIALNPVA
jgi:hypothetical protein|tara:strand:+ start:17594 stop:17992 length:399 start_codon:yes stop_codon:yes gene_type:complete